MLHGTRQLLVRQRTMLSDTMREHLAEPRIVSAKGRHGTTELLKIILEQPRDLRMIRYIPVRIFLNEASNRGYLLTELIGIIQFSLANQKIFRCRRLWKN
jgi:hypothetical protein